MNPNLQWGMQSTTVPTSISDSINKQILAVSEDRIQGFLADPIAAIAKQSGVDRQLVVERIAGMLRAGTIRRVRQTLLATSLARGSLVAWQVPEEKLHGAFEYMFREDPFSGHVVIRSTDAQITGSGYRLWTTLKVPQGYSLAKHCELLAERTGARKFVLLPAKKLFVLGVGHIRRRGMEVGSKSDEPADVIDTRLIELNEREWRVLTALKREFMPEELEEAGGSSAFWRARAEEAGVALDEFHSIAEELQSKGVIGRFSTFLEHVKPLADGQRVTRFNGLFHWAVPPGREIDAGRQVGRFHVMTHAYWREGGPEFGDVNIMGVAHGQEKELLLEHKRAIDEHLQAVGIPVKYTNVFWGGRSEIKPSEISPLEYRRFCEKMGVEEGRMRE